MQFDEHDPHYDGDCGASHGSRRMWGAVFAACFGGVVILIGFAIWHIVTVLQTWMH